MKITSESLILLLFLLAACSGKPESAQTALPAPTTSPTLLPSNTPGPTHTPLPTLTPTTVPTVDFSQVKYVSMYFTGDSQTVLTFSLNGIQGEFHGMGNEHLYDCSLPTSDPNTLYCYGTYQAPGREMLFNLFENNRDDPILSLGIIVPSSIPPTPFGMQCEAEPLWLSFGGGVGCYAISCYIGSSYYTGTADSCTNPLPWPVP